MASSSEVWFTLLYIYNGFCLGHYY
jgi:hypothetical protein